MYKKKYFLKPVLSNSCKVLHVFTGIHASYVIHHFSETKAVSMLTYLALKSN